MSNINYIDTTVYFVKCDEVYGQIVCDDFDTQILLREKFSFFAEGYQFHPSYRNKLWDGKIYLIDMENKIRLGLYSDVEQFCNVIGVKFKLDPRIKKLELNDETFSKFVESLNIHLGKEKITPYDYQQMATHHSLKWMRQTLLSPTSSGKSLIVYMLLRMYEKVIKGKILIIVPLVGLVKQFQSDFDDYSSEINWEQKDLVHSIMTGVKKETDKNIVLSTFQSLKNVDESYFHNFEAVIVDEVHKAKSKSIIRIMDNCINAKWRVGLTGTLDECKTNEMIIKGMFGPTTVVTTTKELMDVGRVANLSIDMIVLRHKKEERKFLRSDYRGKVDKKGDKIRSKATYAEEMRFILYHSERNRFIMRFASKLKGNTIIMIHEKEHGKSLFEWMKKALPDRDIFLYTGDVNVDDREMIRNKLETLENAIIIGSLGAISTGISIKRLHNLLFSHPIKSKVAVLQSAGRILRLCKFGNDVNIYDIVDDFCIGAYVNYTYEHGQERLRYYNEEQHKYTMRSIEL